jgi:hypothetical protein
MHSCPTSVEVLRLPLIVHNARGCLILHTIVSQNAEIMLVQSIINEPVPRRVERVGNVDADDPILSLVSGIQ